MKKAIILGLFLLAVGTQTISAQDFPIDEYERLIKKYKCVSEVWVEDKDSKGTNVRDTPSIKGKIIDVFAPETEDEPEGSIYILDYSNGWVKVLLKEGGDTNPNHDKTGWVSAKLVTANVQTRTGKPAVLYSLPKRSSKKVGKISSENLIKIVGFGCFGFKIEYKGIVGWISNDDVCGNPLTTCV